VTESPGASSRRLPAGGWVLLCCRARQLANSVDERLREAPFQTLSVLILLGLIWYSLYLLLDTVLRYVAGWTLVGAVAFDRIFVHFFFVLSLMLAFSNAILAFGSLYSREEAGHLLTLPVLPRQIMFVKWLEGLLLSSWSFLLLGVPLMLATAAQQRVDWTFYPLFVGHFLGFVVIPSTLGILAAWAIAMFVPRSPITLALWIGGAALTVAVLWLWRVSQTATEADQWIRRLLEDLSFARSPYLPSAWTANGITAAIQQRVGESLFYLGVVAGNAVFLVWLTVNLTGRTWAEAFSRAQHGRAQPTVRHGWVTEMLCAVLFFYLPRRLYMLMLKDVRAFARDATQWTQMTIMLGLLVLYAVNLHRLPIDVTNITMQALIAFLNLATVSLILATFTSRFVFPLLSLESQQLWLLGLLPVRRTTLLFVKFLFALTVTGVSALVVMGLAVTVLDLPPLWARLHLATTVGVCVGLCGLSVGLGACYPMLGQRNPARIAAGFGGSVNLIASMLFVAVVLCGMGLLTLRELRSTLTVGTLSPEGWRLICGILGLCVAVGGTALLVGGRRFARLET
jgi:ABC-2 type transport system permease protein